MCFSSVEGDTRRDRFLVSMANSIMVNLSITIKSNQFVGKKYRVSDFLKKQRNKESKFLVATLQSKKKKEERKEKE